MVDVSKLEEANQTNDIHAVLPRLKPFLLFDDDIQKSLPPRHAGAVKQALTLVFDNLATNTERGLRCSSDEIFVLTLAHRSKEIYDISGIEEETFQGIRTRLTEVFGA